MQMTSKRPRYSAWLLGALVLLLSTLNAAAQNTLPTVQQPTGGTITQIVVSGGNRSLFKVALPNWGGDADTGRQAIDIASRDFVLSSMFQVLDPQSFTANQQAEVDTIDPTSWRNVGAEGVIKGYTSVRAGGALHIELKLFVVSRGSSSALAKAYDVPAGSARVAVHQFVNEVIKWFTGAAGSFGTRLVFSATTGRGQRGLFTIDSDGSGLSRLPTASNVALAPAIGPGGNVYYAGGLPDGSYALFKVGATAPVLTQAGLIFGVAFSGPTMALVVSQGGQSDIFVGAGVGASLTKKTTGGLNTHPAFGPAGQLAYASNASGSPQIYVDSGTGGKRVSQRGTYNMAPVWCNDPAGGTRVLFMGQDGATWDIFSVDPSGNNMQRLTQNQGSNTYPACSPDGRVVAFFSTRNGGGIYTSNPQGMNQQRISTTTGESLRWEGN
jgi:TolB protein